MYSNWALRWDVTFSRFAVGLQTVAHLQQPATFCLPIVNPCRCNSVADARTPCTSNARDSDRLDSSARRASTQQANPAAFPSAIWDQPIAARDWRNRTRIGFARASRHESPSAKCPCFWTRARRPCSPEPWPLSPPTPSLAFIQQEARPQRWRIAASWLQALAERSINQPRSCNTTHRQP